MPTVRSTVRYAVVYERDGKIVSEKRGMGLATMFAALDAASRHPPESGLEARVYRHSAGVDDDVSVMFLEAVPETGIQTRRLVWTLMAAGGYARHE